MIFNTNFTEIFTGICGANGWSGLSFSQNRSMSNSSLSFLIWKGDNGYTIYQMKNHPDYSNLLNVDQEFGILPFATSSYLFNVREFTIQIPSQLLSQNSFQYIHFACNTKSQPVMTQYNGTIVPSEILPHQIVNTVFLKDYPFDTQGDCYLVTLAFPKLSDISSFVFIIENIVLLISVPLWVYFKDYQPLKSRSILPISAIVLLYGITMSSLTYNYLELEWCTRYQCIIYSLIVVPAYLVLTILVFLVSDLLKLILRII